MDDDEKNMKLARDVLAFAGYQVLQAVTGEEAIAVARDHAPDVILMDIRLPGMDGITALQHLKSEARTAAIPVVALTSLAMKGDRERFLAAGFDGYLEKPIRVREIPEEVRRYLALRGGQGEL